MIMLGLSVFFASSFSNVFETQERLTSTQGQFVINEIVRKKFANVEELIDGGTDDYVVFQNKIERDVLPFTYIGLSDEKLVFKDFFVFNGMYGSTSSTNSGILNSSGITKVGDDYYVVAPLENEIYQCNPIANCSPFALTWSGDDNLNHPIDITTNDAEDTLYITDAGNDRIVQITIIGGVASELTITGEVNYPTGIDFYNDGTNDYLFFSEPYENKVYRVDIDGNNLITVVGDGENTDCDNSALYCKLNFPTGVFADDDSHALYIADTGNNRILKMSDPGPITNEIKFSLSSNTILESIEYTFTNLNDLSGLSPDIQPHIAHFESGTDNTEAQFFTNVTSSECDFGTCTGDGCVPPCILKRLLVDDIVFENGDNILVDATKTYNVSNTSSSPNKIYLDNSTDIDVFGGVVAKLNSSTPQNTEITLTADLSTYTQIDKYFINVSININDGEDVQEKLIRFGDGVLGTPEDIIEIAQSGLTYPTGVFWTIGLQIGDNIDFDETVVTFDYTTDFTITDLTFSKLNGDTILEAEITTPEQTYTINAALP